MTSWQKHVDITTRKAKRTLGFIRRNLGDCSKQVKVTAYTTMIRPTLEYSSPVWEPKPLPLRLKLEQFQQKAARFVHSAYTNRTPGCVTKMVQDLGWESLERRRYISWLMMICKIQHQIVEVSGASEVLQLNVTKTRGSHRFKLTETNTQIQYTEHKYKSIYVNEKPLALTLKTTEGQRSKNDFANSSKGTRLGEEKAGTHVNVTEIKQKPKNDQK